MFPLSVWHRGLNCAESGKSVITVGVANQKQPLVNGRQMGDLFGPQQLTTFVFSFCADRYRVRRAALHCISPGIL